MKNFDPNFLSDTRAAEPCKRDISINLFGPLTATCQSSGTAIELTASARELLGCLALFALDRPLRREKLAEMLWPDTSADASRHRLRTGLWRLRKALGTSHQDVIAQDTDHVWLHLSAEQAPIHEVFRRGVELHCTAPRDDMDQDGFLDLTTLLNSYCGPLMDGIDAEWLVAERERYADLHLRGLHRQLKWYRTTGQQEDSIQIARQMLKLDPYREDVHAMLIGLYAATGQPRRAVAQYHDCDAVMRDDLGLEAEQARSALHTALLQRNAPTHQPSVPSSDLEQVLIGLQHSVRALSAQVDALRAALTDR